MRLWMLCLALPLWSNPTHPSVQSGEVLIVGEGSTRLTLTSQSARAIVNWEDFSIGPHERVDCLLPTAQSALLNRVVGPHLSELKGHLRSNGEIYLINERGIVIGRDARIDTGAFVASTLDISDAAFLEGGELLFSGQAEGQITHLGSIRARNGDVFLIATRVSHEGTILAPEGHAGIAAGQEVLLKPPGFERLYIRPQSEAIRKDCGIHMQGLTEALHSTLAADGSLYTLAICQNGSLEATKSIALEAPKGRIEISGTSTAPQGNISIQSEELIVRRLGVLDTTSPQGGGTISIQAKLLFAEPDTYIGADALAQGTGGTITLEGRELLSFAGMVSARGGPQGGNGGLITLRGEGEIDPFGKIDLNAPLGNRGVITLEGHQATVGGILPPFYELLRSPRHLGATVPATCLVSWLEEGEVALYASDSLSLTGSLTAKQGTLFLHSRGDVLLDAQYALGGPLTLTAEGSIVGKTGSSLTASDALQMRALQGDLTLEGSTIAVEGPHKTPLLLLAGHTLLLENTSVVNGSSGGTVDLVADFHAPHVGTGELIVDASSHITTEGRLTLYGAQYSQLRVDGHLNGQVPHIATLASARYPHAPFAGIYGKIAWNLTSPSSAYPDFFFSDRFRYDRRGLYATPVHLTSALTPFVAMVALHQEKYLAP